MDPTLRGWNRAEELVEGMLKSIWLWRIEMVVKEGGVERLEEVAQVNEL
jgi:hypothetical protein